jgi:hypothetical protein
MDRVPFSIGEYGLTPFLGIEPSHFCELEIVRYKNNKVSLYA